MHLIKYILTMITIFAVESAIAQVSKTIVVEHFTNTRCGICASKNPGLYENLAGHPEILHLAIHPSSPYANCLLHLHNPAENDGRTNYYGVYGGTPRLVMQGEPQSVGINFNSPAIFDPFEGQTTPFSMSIKEYRIGDDSVRAELTIKTISTTSRNEAAIFLAYAEDTVFYSAPNGENTHHDVFRMAFTGVGGTTVDLPAPGDSAVMAYTIEMNGEWDPDRMYVIGILQDELTKEVLQAAKTTEVEYLSFLAPADKQGKLRIAPFPNPASTYTTLNGVSGHVRLYTLDGKLVQDIDAGDRGTDLELALEDLQPGVYIIRHNAGSSLLTIAR